MQIPEIFNSTDTIFHYCKLNTALEYILYEKRLRLSPRHNATDPIEKIRPFVSVGGYFGERDEDPDVIHKRSANTIQELTDLVKESVDLCKQVCFCMNDLDPEYDDKYYEDNSLKPYEYYGFLKPRMWDQYANNYKGVCLAFSKKELMKNKELFHNKINYLDYGIFDFVDHRIDLNGLSHKGDDAYSKEYIESFKKMLFNKHLDYKGENEYRFCILDNNSHYDIDITNSIKGIIISENYTSQFAQDALLKYSRDIGVEILKINWTSSGFDLSNKKQIESMEKVFKELTSS